MDAAALGFNALIFALGVAMLVIGGDTLVRGAVAIAARFGVEPVIVGLTAVAFGTSAPELALNIVAAVNDEPGLSFGNIVGSNIANVGLILGVSALIKPMTVRDSLIRREMPMMLAATALMIALAYLPPGMGGTRSGPPALTRLDGVVLLASFGLTFLTILRMARRGRGLDLLGPETQDVSEKARQAPLGRAVGLFIAGLILLLLGGRAGEQGAVGMSEELGLSRELIGLTVVAIATSLPELATSLAAAARGHTDLAVGNIVGSNLFNILLIMGATATVNPVPLPQQAWISLGMMALLSVLLIPMSLTQARRISRIEGAFLLALYGGYLGWEVWAALASRGGG